MSLPSPRGDQEYHLKTGPLDVGVQMEAVNLAWNRILLCTKLTGQSEDEIYSLAFFLTPNSNVLVISLDLPCYKIY